MEEEPLVRSEHLRERGAAEVGGGTDQGLATRNDALVDGGLSTRTLGGWSGKALARKPLQDRIGRGLMGRQRPSLGFFWRWLQRRS